MRKYLPFLRFDRSTALKSLHEASVSYTGFQIRDKLARPFLAKDSTIVGSEVSEQDKPFSHSRKCNGLDIPFHAFAFCRRSCPRICNDMTCLDNFFDDVFHPPPHTVQLKASCTTSLGTIITCYRNRVILA